VSLLEREVTNLDAGPRVTAEDIAQVEATKKHIQDLLGTLDV